MTQFFGKTWCGNLLLAFRFNENEMIIQIGQDEEIL
jgi:hypothetical protein